MKDNLLRSPTPEGSSRTMDHASRVILPKGSNIYIFFRMQVNCDGILHENVIHSISQNLKQFYI
jgi:hypothetical protein